jgi:hypothetical protein
MVGQIRRAHRLRHLYVVSSHSILSHFFLALYFTFLVGHVVLLPKHFISVRELLYGCCFIYKPGQKPILKK